MQATKTKVVRILRPVIMYGEHAEVDELHEVPIGTAQELVGSGVAAYEDPEENPAFTVRMNEPIHRDPVPASREPVPQRRDPAERTPAQQPTPKQERPGAQRPQQQQRPARR